MRDHVHVDRARELYHRRPDPLVEQPGRPRAPRRAQHELGRVDATGEVEQRIRHVVADHGVEGRTEILGELAVLAHLGGPETGEPVPAQHVQREQFGACPHGDPAGAPDDRLAFRPAGDGHDNPLPRLPGVGDPQRGQVAGPEVVAQRGVDSRGRVDVAVREPPPQRLGCDVDQLDLLSLADHLVRHRLLLGHPGDLLDHVVEALQVLDVHCGQYVDPGLQQFQDVLPALFIARARDVGVRQLVHNGHFGLAGEHGIGVQLGELVATMDTPPPGHDLQTLQQLGGLLPAVCLDQAHDHVRAALQPPPCLAEHGEGLAHPGRRAEVDTQFPPARLVLLHVHPLSVLLRRPPRDSAPAR